MAKSIISNNPAQLVTKARANLTDWTSYTPTIQGLGTVSSLQADWIQIGSKIHVKGYFVVGTPTAEEIQISLPNSYTVGGSVNNGVVPTGKMLIHGSSNTRLHFLSTFGDSFVNIGTEFRTAVSNGENPVLGNAVLNPGQTVSFDFEVPVQELSGSDVTFLAAQPTEQVMTFQTSASGRSSQTGSTSYQTAAVVALVDDTFGSLSSNQITLPAGKYVFQGSCAHFGDGDSHYLGIYDVGNTTYLYDKIIGFCNGSNQASFPFNVVLNLASETTIEFRQRYSNAVSITIAFHDGIIRKLK